ncbi:serine/threonine-protein kinase [Streptomyces naphthomycinicus]|uniref:serine/threonine-protein kinase n=1 Tax=Streptomyces naphthomycinicus TaxID=2872625 RepID=UPI001CEDEA72|nr:serine/threonine-protein kinase [Streptomyces sp. TML10]
MDALRPQDPAHIGTHTLLARLGAGGMGQVYLGRSPGGRLVAVKVIRDEITDHPEALARFRREVETARTVRSAYTANLIDASLDTAPYWLATEYVAGPTLAGAVARRGPLPAETCRGLLAALAEGLAAVHAHGVTHRDLKPQNVILAAQGPQLIDFGIARAAGHTALTGTGFAPGTPGYTAPEVLLRNEVGPPADVFALGATLAFAATGRAPFGTGDPHGVSYRAVHEPVDLAGAAPELAALIEACVAKDPAARPGLGEVIARCGIRTALPEDPYYAGLAAPDGAAPDEAAPGIPAPPARRPVGLHDLPTAGPAGSVPNLPTAGPAGSVPNPPTAGPAGSVPNPPTAGPAGSVPNLPTAGPAGSVPNLPTAGPAGSVPNPPTAGQAGSVANAGVGHVPARTVQPTVRAASRRLPVAVAAGLAVGIIAATVVVLARQDEGAGAARGGTRTAASPGPHGKASPTTGAEGAPVHAEMKLDRTLFESATGRCQVPSEEHTSEGFMMAVEDLDDPDNHERILTAGHRVRIGFRDKYAFGTKRPYYVTVGVKPPHDIDPDTGKPVAGLLTTNVSSGYTSKPLDLYGGAEQGDWKYVTYPDDFRQWVKGKAYPAVPLANDPGDWTVQAHHIRTPADYRSVMCQGFTVK